MKEWKKVLLLTIAGLLYRVVHYFVFSNKIVAGSDVMQNILLARRFASGDIYGVLDTYWTPVYPILVGIVSIFTEDLVIPAVVVSMVAGSLAVPLTYYLTKQSYGERIAVIAAVIAIFFPYLLNSVFALGLENVYLVWMIGALIVGWDALTKDSVVSYLLTGILLGLAYLTRPEAIGYPMLFALLALGKSLWQRKPLTRKWIPQVSALMIGFAILATPYIFYLRSETGTWTISGKAMANFAEGELHQDDEADPRPALDQQVGKVLVRNFAFGLRQIHIIFTDLLPILLLIFAALGLFGNKWSTERSKREFYLLLFCLITMVGYAASVVETRYFYVLLPIFFGWIASGIVQAEQWVKESVQNSPARFSFLVNGRLIPIVMVIVIFLYVFPTNFYVRSQTSAWQGAAYEERDAGLWLRENGKPSANILSASFRPVFYAGGKQVWSRDTDIGGILARIKSNDIDYVIDSERTFARNPHLRDLSAALQNEPTLELVFQENPMPGYKISIFKVK